MNKEIIEAIKKRRKINRERRNCKDKERRKELEEQYNEQRKVVQRLVREAIIKYETELAREMRKDKNGGLMWKKMKQIRGKEKDKEKEDKIYEDGKVLEREKAARIFFDIWKEIYSASINEIREVWGERTKAELIERFREEERNNDGGPRDHMDMIRRVEVRPMRVPELKKETLEEQLKKIKNNKATGPDKLKGEFYKELGKSDVCVNTMVKCFNNTLEGGETPTSWTKSVTKMIKKTRRPTPRDFRPIALLNSSYKIYMSFIKDEIEKHVKENGLGRDNQMGFTKGNRTEYNHLTIQYIVDRTIGTEEKKEREREKKEKKRKI